MLLGIGATVTASSSTMPTIGSTAPRASLSFSDKRSLYKDKSLF